MSPPNRAPARRQRSLMVSLAIVVLVAIGSLAGTLAAQWSPRLGLDLAGGFSVVYKPAHPVSSSDLNEITNILTNRVNGLGVSGATVNTQGTQIQVQVPGVKDPNAVLKLLGTTGQLLFRPVLCDAPPYSVPKSKKGSTTPAASPGALPSNCSSAYQLTTSNPAFSDTGSAGATYDVGPDPSLAAYPSTPSSLDAKADLHKTVLLPGLGSSERYLLGPAELRGSIVKSALAQLSSVGAWVVNFNLTGSGSGQW